MANVSKSVADAIARTSVFDLLGIQGVEGFKPISSQSYGVALPDGNGVLRLVEVKAIVRKVDEELDGNELLEFEAEEYQNSVKEKAEKKAAAEEAKRKKIERDKKKREEKKEA